MTLHRSALWTHLVACTFDGFADWFTWPPIGGGGVGWCNWRSCRGLVSIQRRRRSQSMGFELLFNMDTVYERRSTVVYIIYNWRSCSWQCKVQAKQSANLSKQCHQMASPIVYQTWPPSCYHALAFTAPIYMCIAPAGPCMSRQWGAICQFKDCASLAFFCESQVCSPWCGIHSYLLVP